MNKIYALALAVYYQTKWGNKNVLEQADLFLDWLNARGKRK